MSSWDPFLTETDHAVLSRGRWAQRAGTGERPALIIIDAQNYMTGIRGKPDNEALFPLSCGPAGFAALDQIKRLLLASRECHVPVFFTRFVIDPYVDGAGMFHRKLGTAPVESDALYLEGTFGAEIVADLAPAPGEIVLDKIKKSAFFGTPLLSHLLDRRVDTCIVVGGSTSNCVRATVVDSEQHNFFTVIPEEAVFDRLPFSHAASLFDMDRSYGDVMPVEQVLTYIHELGGAPAARAA